LFRFREEFQQPEGLEKLDFTQPLFEIRHSFVRPVCDEAIRGNCGICRSENVQQDKYANLAQ
jgi:hypothetical protein